MLRLNPVPTAMYAARHAGHLGKSIRITGGNDHWVKMSEPRPRGDRTEILSVATRGAIALLEIDLQQVLITCSHGSSTMLPSFSSVMMA